MWLSQVPNERLVLAIDASMTIPDVEAGLLMHVMVTLLSRILGTLQLKAA